MLVLCTQAAYGKVTLPIDRDSVVQQVADLNIKGDYGASQQVIVSLLAEKGLQDKDRLFLTILLADTYKRINAYSKVFSRVEDAYTIVGRMHNDSALMVVRANHAFALFDVQEFAKADSLTRLILTQGRTALSPYDLGLLQMQQGHIAMLNGRYTESDSLLSIALGLVSASAPCHVANVLVKFMELSAVQGKKKERDRYYGRILSMADSCGIIKYRLLGLEVMLRLAKADPNADANTILMLSNEFDSLWAEFDAEQQLIKVEQELDHFQQIQEAQAEEALWNERLRLWVGIGSLGAIVSALSILFFRFRKRQRQDEQELLLMKNELTRLMSETEQVGSEATDKQMASGLSRQQARILELLRDYRSNKEIAVALNVSENTVKTHIRAIYRLMGISGRKDLFGKGDQQ